MLSLKDLYPLIIEAFSNDQTFTFPINGTSMQPLLHTGDLVTIKKCSEARVGDIVFYRRSNGQFVLHRVRRAKGDVYTIVGDHQTKLEHNVTSDMLIGVVISYRIKGKEENRLNTISYRLYRLMVRVRPIRYLFAHLL